jgi:hypothetical protein
MSDGERHRTGRVIKAAVAAGLIGVVLWSAWVCVPSDYVAKDSLYELVSTALLAALCGAILGVAGASTDSFRNAGLVGAGIMAVVGLPLVAASILPHPPSLVPHSLLNLLWESLEGAWLLAAVCSFGSVVAQVGAVAGGTRRNDLSRLGQFTLRQLLAFFIPVAIYLGYVGAHTRK